MCQADDLVSLGIKQCKTLKAFSEEMPSRRGGLVKNVWQAKIAYSSSRRGRRLELPIIDRSLAVEGRIADLIEQVAREYKARGRQVPS